MYGAPSCLPQQQPPQPGYPLSWYALQHATGQHPVEFYAPHELYAKAQVHTQQPHIEVLNAWYGTEQVHSDNNGNVQGRIRDNLQRHGQLNIPPNTNEFFGFDPTPGQQKLTAIHVRAGGQEHHLRAHEGQEFNWRPQPTIEVLNAWYGTEQVHSDKNGAVQEALRAVLRQCGRIHVPANTNAFFGFDPVPGQVKVTAIHVRGGGQEHHLRAHEGQEFNWRPQATVEVLNAWYGTEQVHSDNHGAVQELLRASVRTHGHIVVPGNMNAFFGFDPVPGQVKVVAIHVRANGQEDHLRGHEGEDFIWMPY